MNVSTIGAGQQNQAKFLAAASEKEKQKPGDVSEINKLNAEIEQAEAKMQETVKEVQSAVGESIGGSSEKAQMLQNKLLMQQQEIMTKQMQVKEIESPKESAAGQAASVTDTIQRFDRYISEQENAKTPDNVYRIEEKDGTRQVIFNRLEK